MNECVNLFTSISSSRNCYQDNYLPSNFDNDFTKYLKEGFWQCSNLQFSFKVFLFQIYFCQYNFPQNASINGLRFQPFCIPPVTTLHIASEFPKKLHLLEGSGAKGSLKYPVSRDLGGDDAQKMKKKDSQDKGLPAFRMRLLWSRSDMFISSKSLQFK